MVLNQKTPGAALKKITSERDTQQFREALCFSCRPLNLSSPVSTCFCSLFFMWSARLIVGL